jgi:hypothetical protein
MIRLPYLVPALSALALLSATTARAGCVEGPTNAYVCTGTQTGGLTDGDAGVTVDVLTGATVENSGNDALRLRGAGPVVTNHGTLKTVIDGDGVDSNDATKSGLTLINTGTIDVAARGVNADNRNDVTVINSGLINAPTNDGIRLGAGANARVENIGTLKAGDEGLEAGNDAVVLNGPGALFQAVEDGVQVGENARIENEGTIESIITDPDPDNWGDGIDIDSGTIVNTGTIRSVDGAGIDYDASTVAQSQILNSGTIEGGTGVEVELGGGVDPANTKSQWIRSDGIITGLDGIAIELGAGDDIVEIFDSLSFLNPVAGVESDTLTLGSAGPVEVNGITDLGDDDDSLGIFNTAGGGLYQAALSDLFDGGNGTDTARFSASRQEFVAASGTGADLQIRFSNGVDGITLDLANFEWIAFGVDPLTGTGGKVFSVNRIARGPSAIPVPAAVWLAGSGLAALAGLRLRRRGRRA